MSTDVLQSPRSPSLPILALVIAAPAVTAGARWLLGPGPFGFGVLTVAAIGLGCAVLIGMPLLFLAIERHKDGPLSLTVLGAVAGAIGPLLLLASGILGVLWYSTAGHLRWTLSVGAPIPAYGQLAWAKFASLVLQAAVVGALTGAICAFAARRSRS